MKSPTTPRLIVESVTPRVVAPSTVGYAPNSSSMEALNAVSVASLSVDDSKLASEPPPVAAAVVAVAAEVAVEASVVVSVEPPAVVSVEAAVVSVEPPAVVSVESGLRRAAAVVVTTARRCNEPHGTQEYPDLLHVSPPMDWHGTSVPAIET